MIPRLSTPLADWIATAAPGERVIVFTGANMRGLPAETRQTIDRLRGTTLTTAQRPSPSQTIRGGRAWDLIVVKLKGNA